MRKILILALMLIIAAAAVVWADGHTVPEGTYFTELGGESMFLRFGSNNSCYFAAVYSDDDDIEIREISGRWVISENMLFIEVEIVSGFDGMEYFSDIDEYTDELGEIIEISEDRIILNNYDDIIYLVRI